ncbi:hypothetical protein DPMN_192313 [Dreissena polymorpha]|uniref:Uncharacterized protein n=1 Tax=Dreissena polymorpha TaxID=45954 RepID=A0A9D3Y0N7_DREPO|nr:hypothetical protein DPMN_192313 [Dreissena polymorpha]
MLVSGGTYLALGSEEGWGGLDIIGTAWDHHGPSQLCHGLRHREVAGGKDAAV